MFGGSGWGPYSDGPLNAVRKSVLSRDGVGEENWMFMMATRVGDASAEWGKLRTEAVKVVEGVDGLVLGGALMPPTEMNQLGANNKQGIEEANEEEEEEEGIQDQATVDGEKPILKRRKVEEGPAVGIYEPHSHTVHCELIAFHIFFGITLKNFDSQTGRIHNPHRLDGRLSPILLRNGVCWVVQKRVMVLGHLHGLIRSWNCLALQLLIEKRQCESCY